MGEFTWAKSARTLPFSNPRRGRGKGSTRELGSNVCANLPALEQRRIKLSAPGSCRAAADILIAGPAEWIECTFWFRVPPRVRDCLLRHGCAKMPSWCNYGSRNQPKGVYVGTMGRVRTPWIISPRRTLERRGHPLWVRVKH